jgi:WD40 repeat protein/tRNA A-37 threonylcarbamoyl transferase component Bud32
MGIVYMARDPVLGRKVALKLLRADSAAVRLRGGRARLLREAQAMAQLSHPNVIVVHDVGVSADRVFLAMELVEGGTLKEWLRATGGRTWREVVRVFRAAGEGLAAAHAAGLVHRDFKPDNVLVGRDGQVRVTDFGLVRASLESLSASDGVDAPLQHLVELVTVSGALVGTPAYMAPEQLARGKADVRSDVFAFCVSFYEGLYGERPFTAPTIAELSQAIARGVIRPAPAAARVPPWLRRIVVGGLHADPARRAQSVRALLDAIDARLGRVPRGASGLGVDEVPRLARDVAEAAVRDYPQPIAEAVVELDGARSVWHALDAAARLTRVTLRWLTVITLSARVVRRAEQPLAAAATESLSALRKRRLEDDEWLELLRALVAPFAACEREHPVPELVALLRSPAAATLAALVARDAERGVGALPTDRAALDELSEVLAQTAEWLRALGFLADYPLAVVGADDHAALWTGVRRKHRIARALGMHLEAGVPILFGKDGRVLVLAPLAVAAPPSDGAEPELFVLEGRGRRGLLLVAWPGGFEQTSEPALKWLESIAAASSEDVASSQPTLDAPYRGLAPLTAADADVFLGREREVEGFLNRLRTEPLLVVVGPSGTGKSSFLRAGLVPSLGESFHAIVLRPGARPLGALRAKLARFGIRTEDLTREEDAGEVAVRVHTAAAARDETIVLAIDQFEEAFTLGHDRDERAAFCSWLSRIAASPSDPARVVLTLRDDYLAQLQGESGFERRLTHALELLTTPDEAALRRILVEPARRAGFTFENDALVDQMVHAVKGRPGALALLSFAASKLWEQRAVESHALTAAAYESMGGVAGALAQHGEAVLEQMGPKQRMLVREAFRRLVTAEGTRASTRHDELLAVLGGDEAAREVVERLVDSRLLLIAEGEDGANYVEVIHEALLSAWPRLVEWQREDAARNRFRDRVRVAAQQWAAHGRPRGLLWRDELVEDYRRWRLQHPGALTASEEAFGRASLAERHRGRRLRAAVMGFITIAAIVTSYVAWQQGLARKAAQAATVKAEQALLQAQAADQQAEQSGLRARDAARLAAARAYVEDPTTQLALLRDVESNKPLPDWAAQARAALHAGIASVVYAADPQGGVVSVAFSPDGRRIASVSREGTVRIWNADELTDTAVFRGHIPVSTASFSPDRRRVASGSLDQTVLVWNADGSGVPLVLRGHTAGVTGVAFSPDGTRIASSSSDRTVRVWNADGSGTPLVLRGHTDSVTGVSFSPDGKRIASGSNDSTVRVWNVDSTGDPMVLRGPTDHVWSVSFSPDGRRIAASFAATLYVWNADGAGGPVVLHGHTSYVWSLSFSPDGRRIASGGFDRTVRIWNADGSGEPRVLLGHTDMVRSVSFSLDGRRVVSGDVAGNMRIWSADVAEEPLILRGHTAEINRIAASPDGRFIASSSTDKTVRVWNADGSGEPIVLRHPAHVTGVSFSPDGRRIASGCYCDDAAVRVWNADGSGQPVLLRGHTGPVVDVSFSPDGRIASASWDKTLRVWSADRSGEPVVLRGAPDRLQGAAFSPDGRLVASASGKAVLVWNADGSGEPVVLRGHTDKVYEVAFSPDGRRVAATSSDGTVGVWNADGSGEPLVLRGTSASTTYGLSFHPDGRRIAAGFLDKTVVIWDVDGVGDPVVLYGHTEGVSSATFSLDGCRLYTGALDDTIRIWGDFAPLLPTDARLWQATNYCLPLDQLKKLIGVDGASAEALHARCVERVAGAGAEAIRNEGTNR